jgi:hypothetical protein
VQSSAEFGKNRERTGYIDQSDQSAGQRPVRFEAVDDGDHAGRDEADDDARPMLSAFAISDGPKPSAFSLRTC